MTQYHLLCDEAREALWPDPTGPAPVEARQHFDECLACQRFFTVQQALGRRLERLRKITVPDHLRERVRAAIAAERPAQRRGWWVAAGLAAAATLAIGIGLRGPGGDDLAMPFVAEAARVLTPPATFQSSDASEIESWLQVQVGTEVQLPDIADATLMGGRVVNVAGIRTPAAVYDLRGTPLTYFAVPSAEVAGFSASPGSDLMAASADGFEVMVWGEPNGLRAVAARMPRAEIRTIADECRTKALRGLSF